MRAVPVPAVAAAVPAVPVAQGSVVTKGPRPGPPGRGAITAGGGGTGGGGGSAGPAPTGVRPSASLPVAVKRPPPSAAEVAAGPDAKRQAVGVDKPPPSEYVGGFASTLHIHVLAAAMATNARGWRWLWARARVVFMLSPPRPILAHPTPPQPIPPLPRPAPQRAPRLCGRAPGPRPGPAHVPCEAGGGVRGGAAVYDAGQVLCSPCSRRRCATTSWGSSGFTRPAG